MDKIPIFDSLTHPTPDGTWLDPRFNHRASAESLVKEMKDSNTKYIFAVGMGPTIGGYREDTYAGWVNSNISNAFPVAYCSPYDLELHSIKLYMANLRKLGYYGIKLHPRIGKFEYNYNKLPVVINEANDNGLFVMICSYGYSYELDITKMHVEYLFELFKLCTNPKIILLHGGITKLLEVSEAIKPWKNIILDLSFTLQKFAGSSLDYDIIYLFNNFDRRICIGSDHPQFTLSSTRERLTKLGFGIPLEKIKNIAYLNLERFVKGNL